MFTPEGEREWVDGWDPKPVYPADTARFSRDTVFRLQNTETSMWTIVRADAIRHAAEYVYVAEGSRVAHIHVDVRDISTEHSRVEVRYVVTSFSEHGDLFVQGFTEQAFAEKMRDWERRVTEVLNRK